MATNVSVATSMWARFWGLMGKSRLPENDGLLLKPCSSVHMFFMRFPLDVIFIDKSGRVTKAVSNLKPWRVAMGGGGHSALELLPGAISAADVEKGDVMEFSDE